MDTEVLRIELGERTLEIEQVLGLGRLAKQSLRDGTDPYWAYLWPSGRALALVVDGLGDLGGRRCLELGCGLGAPGLAAAIAGADVTLTDVRAEALEMAARNASRNQLAAKTLVMDWRTPPVDLGRFDLVLGADILYDDGMLASVLRFLRRHLAEDGMALITDPLRVAAVGLTGAARLHGLEARALDLVPPGFGVTLFEVRPRPRPV